MIKFKFNKLFILLFSLLILGILYRRYENKLNNQEKLDNYDALKNYLLDTSIFGNGEGIINSKKPILWIHIPYEYNSRNWISFGSRSSFQLNQPYLYITLQSIINKCSKSFTICIIDDNSFSKLIPDWTITMNKLSTPISNSIRLLGMMKLLYIYGGLIVPPSFLCLRNLIDMYNNGTSGNKMFVCEMLNRNSSSSYFDFFPSLNFCGAPKENELVKLLINSIQINNSIDYTAETQFLDTNNRWLMQFIENKKINLIDGTMIGVKTTDNKQITPDDLLSDHYLNIYPNCYGIYIPADELLKRNNYGWFIRSSPLQIVQSNTIIGNYLLLSVAPNDKQGVLEPLDIRPDWVGFWKTPNYPGLYGLKPNYLGNNIRQVPYSGN